MPYHILLTIDVEDWFQVENLKSAIPFESLADRRTAVGEKHAIGILDLLDSIKLEKTADSRQNTEGEGQTPTSCNTKQRTTYNGQQTTASNQRSGSAVEPLKLTINQVNPCLSPP